MSFNSPVKSIYPILPINLGANFLSGFAIKSQDFCDQGLPVIKIKNIQNRLVTTAGSQCIAPCLITEKLGKFLLDDGDILISMTGQGSVGRVGKLRCSKFERPIMNQRVGKFLTNESSLHKDFLYYVMSSEAYEKYLFAMGSGSGQPNLSPNQILSATIPWPPYKEQVAIAAILSALDESITLLRETNATLEAIAQALFKSWFVDFDPVHAKQQGLAPEGMDEATAALFPDSFEESELGLVPRGWMVSNCQKVIDVRDGTHESPKPAFSGYPLITSRHITGGKICFDDTYLIADQDYENISKRSKVHRFDVLITMIGTVGIPVIVLDEQTEFAIKNIGLFKTSATPFLSHYLYLLLSSSKMQQYLEARLAGTTQKYLSLKALREISLLIPPDSVMAVFSEIISPVFEKIHQNNCEATTLATLRDTLLPRLISGQLRLPEAETLIKETP